MGKPTNPEEEYFAREELEKIRKLREKLDAERRALEAERRRELHWMKCPKCGADLKEELMRDVKVDVCPECEGIWLDAGELDILMHGSSNIVGNIVKAIHESFRRNGDQ